MSTLSGTLGVAAPLNDSVTTIKGCGEFLDSMTLAGDDGLLLDWGREYWLDQSFWLFIFASFGAIVIACTGCLLIFFVKMAANVLSAVVVSYLIVAKFTYRWGCFKASVTS